MNKQIDVININEEEIEFLKESNYIEGEYSKEALEDAKQGWMMAKICANEPLSIDYIFAIHRRLMKRLNPQIAGKIRDCRVYIGGEIKGQTKDEIKKELGELVSLWNTNQKILLDKSKQDKENFIKKWHILYESCHNFVDGNGRVGRILMNIQRLKLGLPVLIIYNKNKFDYYKWFKDIN